MVKGMPSALELIRWVPRALFVIAAAGFLGKPRGDVAPARALAALGALGNLLVGGQFGVSVFAT